MPAPRRTQAERSEATRARLLDAALELLVEQGWARTTTQAVAARAGLSRGAQLHHFPTKADLVIAAVTHLADKQLARVLEQAAQARRRGAGPGLDLAVDLIAEIFSGPLFLASLELWVAARTDSALRAALLPHERRIGADLRRVAREVAGLADTDASADAVLDLTLDLARGLGVATLLAPEDSTRRERQLAAWRSGVVALSLGNPRATRGEAA